MPDMLTADGRIVTLREVCDADAPALTDLYTNATEQSLYLRFFSLGTHRIADEVARLTRPSAADHYAVLALDRGQVIGVASYERLDQPAIGEFGVLVADAWHGRGVGTLLIEHLATHAREHGITELVGDVLPTNAMMLKVATGISASIRHDSGSTTVVRVPTALSETAIAARDARERLAEEHSLRPLLAPRSVAVVGAGRSPGGIGHEVLRNIVTHGYTGRVYAVNPHAAEIAGCLSAPTVSDLPETVDLVVVAVPAEAVPAVLRDAGSCGVRAAVVLTAGFSETGNHALQRQVLTIARQHGMRLVGPNCLGVLNSDPSVRLAATFASDLPASPDGGLAVATQSGAVGIAVLDHAGRAGLGVSTFVSLGNKADISGNDLLSYWFDDPATRAVALYLESFGNPRKFARVARAVARRKPVLAVKGGRSIGGQRAGASHTAAAASPAVAVDSLFAQAGVIRVDGLGELLDTARMLVDQPLPTGHRVAIVGNAGGLNVLAADAAEAAGLSVPEISPIDLGAGASPAALGRSIRELASVGGVDGGVDSVVAIFGATRSNNPSECVAEIAAAMDDFPQVPMAAVLVGLDAPPTSLGKRRAPVYALPEQAMRALGHAAGYAAWQQRPLGQRPNLSNIDTGRARAALKAAGEGWQPWSVASEMLAAYGIAVLPTTVVNSLDDAVAAAARAGYPVVLKAADPNLVHKTELRVVRLGLTDANAVAQAYTAIAAALKQENPAVLVQPMRSGAVEMVAGVVHDPLFGSLVMTGLGGIHTDLLGDRTFQLLPVTDVDAAAMWRRLRAARLLTGYRDTSTSDTAALEDVLLRLGRLAEDFPQIAELDLNPLLVFPHGLEAVDIKMRIAAVGTEPDPTERALRA